MYISMNNLLSVALEPKHSKNSDIAKEALKSKQIGMGSQIRRQGPLLSALLLRIFRVL